MEEEERSFECFQKRQRRKNRFFNNIQKKNEHFWSEEEKEITKTRDLLNAFEVNEFCFLKSSSTFCGFFPPL